MVSLIFLVQGIIEIQREIVCIYTNNIKDNDFLFNGNGNFYSNEITKFRENGIFQNKFISINLKDNEDFF